MATLTLTSIRAFNIHPGTTAHITGKSHTYVTFSVNGVQETTSVFDSEASQHAVWKDTITMNLNSGASGELKVTVYNKRKLIHDHEIGSSHINLAHLNKSPGAEVRMVLMGKGQQQGEVSFMPELRVAGGATGGAAGHAAPAVAAGGLAAGGGAAAGRANHGDIDPAAKELSPEVNHGPGLGGSSVLAADKAAVSSSAAEPASKGGYASHVAAPGASAASGTPAGHGEYVNHEKPSGATAGFGGGGAATFDNMGVPTGKAHPDNQPKPASATAGAYPTSGSSVTDPSADLTSPAGDRSLATGAGLGAGAGAGLGAMTGAHTHGSTYSSGTTQPQGPSMLDKAKATAAGAATSVQETAYNLKDRAMGPSSGTSAHTGTSTHTEGPSMLDKAKATAAGAATSVQETAYNLKDRAMGPSSGTTAHSQGPSMLDKAKATAAGAATSVQDTAYSLKDRAMGTFAPAQGTTTTGGAMATGATHHVGAPLSTSEVEHSTTAHHVGAPLSGTTEHKEFGSALDPVAGGAAGTATGEQPTLLGRAQALAGATVGAAVGTASAAASTVAGAPRAALNTASNVTQSVYQRVAGTSPTAGSTTTTEHHVTTETEGVGAKPTLTERAKGLTATAIDTTTHLLDQAKIHVTGHGTGTPVEPPKTMTGTAMAYTAKAIDTTSSVLDTVKDKIVGPSTAAVKPTSHVLPEQ